MKITTLCFKSLTLTPIFHPSSYHTLCTTTFWHLPSRDGVYFPVTAPRLAWRREDGGPVPSLGHKRPCTIISFLSCPCHHLWTSTNQPVGRRQAKWNRGDSPHPWPSQTSQCLADPIAECRQLSEPSRDELSPVQVSGSGQLTFRQEIIVLKH